MTRNIDRDMITLTPIGIIRSPFRKRGDAPHQGRGSQERCTIELFPEFVEGKDGMDSIRYIWVLYWMDRAERNLLRVYREGRYEMRPVFTIRSPARPNPIALSIGEIQECGPAHIVVTGIEALDGSPVIDIKPYIRDLDCVGDNPI